MSEGKNSRPLITAPCAFPEANPLGFHLGTAGIFSNSKMQLKCNSGFPSSVGMLSNRESFAWYLWDWWITCNACVVSLCVWYWSLMLTVQYVYEFFTTIMLCSSWAWCCIHQSSLHLLSNSEDKELSEPAPYGLSWGQASPPPGSTLMTITSTTRLMGGSVCYYQEGYWGLCLLPFYLGANRIHFVIGMGYLIWMNIHILTKASGITSF